MGCKLAEQALALIATASRPPSFLSGPGEPVPAHHHFLDPSRVPHSSRMKPRPASTALPSSFTPTNRHFTTVCSPKRLSEPRLAWPLAVQIPCPSAFCSCFPRVEVRRLKFSDKPLSSHRTSPGHLDPGGAGQVAGCEGLSRACSGSRVTTRPQAKSSLGHPSPSRQCRCFHAATRSLDGPPGAPWATASW